MPGQLVLPAVLVAVAVTVVALGALAVLGVLGYRACSRRRPSAAVYPRLSKAYDWRTLPPKDESGAMAVGDAEEYGPLWRYGVPLGYGRVYDAGYDRGYDPS